MENVAQVENNLKALKLPLATVYPEVWLCAIDTTQLHTAHFCLSNKLTLK